MLYYKFTIAMPGEGDAPTGCKYHAFRLGDEEIAPPGTEKTFSRVFAQGQKVVVEAVGSGKDGKAVVVSPKLEFTVEDRVPENPMGSPTVCAIIEAAEPNAPPMPPEELVKVVEPVAPVEPPKMNTSDQFGLVETKHKPHHKGK